MTKAPTPPRHLGQDGRRLWREVMACYRLEGPGEIALLRVAAEASDRAALARVAVERDGLMIEGRYANAPRVHPAAAVQRDAESVVIRSLAQLGITAPESR